MESIHHFEDLEVWKLARKINRKVYDYTSRDPLWHDFALVDQLRRSAGSIMDNISRGYERDGNKQFIDYLFLSKAACGECRSQIHRALDQNYLTQKEFDELYELLIQQSQKLQALIRYLKKSNPPDRRT